MQWWFPEAFSAVKKRYLSLQIYRQLGKIWWRCNTTQRSFYSELILENTTDKDYEHVKKVWEAFKIKNLGEYHDLYVQCDTFLLADVFENFRNKCIEIYELDPAHFLSAPVLAWQACLKKTKVELELLRDIDMLLMVEKGTRGGICQAIGMLQQIINIWKIMIKISYHHI